MRVLLSPRNCWRLTAVLGLAGLGVTTYLSVVALQGGAPVCGPLSGCAEVTGSGYARWFGIPLSVFGVAIYGALLLGALWLGGAGERDRMVERGMIGLAFAGTLVSAYLTVVEALVIQAFCIYCLLSATFVTAIFALGVVATLREKSLAQIGVPGDQSSLKAGTR